MQLGLLGHGIQYSLSPAIHQAAMHLMGRVGRYNLFDLDCSRAEQFLQSHMQVGERCGLNVTQPYKRKVLDWIQAAGSHQGAAINTLTWNGKAWQADNTDGVGFMRALRWAKIDLSHQRRLVVLGAGGAAAGIVREVRRQHPCLDVWVLSRSGGLVPRDQASHLPLTLPILTAALFDFPSDTVLVQATSGPSTGDDMSHWVPALENFRGSVIDLNYHRPSALWSAARKRSLPCQSGLPMLFEQALAAQEIWWGASAPPADDVLRDLLARRSLEVDFQVNPLTLDRD